MKYLDTLVQVFLAFTLFFAIGWAAERLSSDAATDASYCDGYENIIGDPCDPNDPGWPTEEASIEFPGVVLRTWVCEFYMD